MTIKISEKNPAGQIIVDGKENALSESIWNKYLFLEYAGLDDNGFDVLFEIQPAVPFEILVTDRSIGLPEISGYPLYTPNVIPGPGNNSNTTQVSKRFVL